MFSTDYIFKGKHASIVSKLTLELDSETGLTIFGKNKEVLVLAPIVGFLYGRMSKKDDSGQVTTESIKRINYQQIVSVADSLNFSYQLIMLLHEKDKIDIKERLDRAFKYVDGSEEKNKCYDIFEQYLLGGVEVLSEKILEDAFLVDEYVNNIYNFLAEYNERYNQVISDEEILNLCMGQNL